MTYRGTVKNGVVVFEQDQHPAEGTRVRVEPIEPVESNGDEAGHDEYLRRMLELAGTAGGLPPDLAENHDHYLHGQPKR